MKPPSFSDKKQHGNGTPTLLPSLSMFFGGTPYPLGFIPMKGKPCGPQDRVRSLEWVETSAFCISWDNNLGVPNSKTPKEITPVTKGDLAPCHFHPSPTFFFKTNLFFSSLRGEYSSFSPQSPFFPPSARFTPFHFCFHKSASFQPPGRLL